MASDWIYLEESISSNSVNIFFALSIVPQLVSNQKHTEISQPGF